MGFGVAIFQPALPTLVRLWAPRRIWLATAVSTNGMLVGVAFGAGADHSAGAAAGRRQLAARSAGVVGAGADRGAALRRRGAAPREPRDAQTARRRAAGGRDWNSPQLWLLGFALGTNNALFFAVNAFMPDYLTSTRPRRHDRR